MPNKKKITELETDFLTELLTGINDFNNSFCNIVKDGVTIRESRDGEWVRKEVFDRITDNNKNFLDNCRKSVDRFINEAKKK